nr:MAG TPA: hypothetical protein [Caudoviricetes sp.]
MHQDRAQGNRWRISVYKAVLYWRLSNITALGTVEDIYKSWRKASPP